MSEHQIGEIWTDTIEGLKVITVKDTGKDGCKACAFSTFAGGACPGVVYDRHPCCASDRSDDNGVFFRLVYYLEWMLRLKHLLMLSLEIHGEVC